MCPLSNRLQRSLPLLGVSVGPAAAAGDSSGFLQPRQAGLSVGVRHTALRLEGPRCGVGGTRGKESVTSCCFPPDGAGVWGMGFLPEGFMVAARCRGAAGPLASISQTPGVLGDGRIPHGDSDTVPCSADDCGLSLSPASTVPSLTPRSASALLHIRHIQRVSLHVHSDPAPTAPPQPKASPCLVRSLAPFRCESLMLNLA